MYINLITINLLASATAEEKTGVAVLGIDLKAILLQAGTFLILFFLIKKFAMEKIVNQLEKRRQTIDQGVELGLQMEKKQSEFEEKLKKLESKARHEASEIIEASRKESAEIILQSHKDASEKADRMLSDAKSRIDTEIDIARKELRGEMLGLVAQATELIIEEKLDSKKDASLIERALGRIKA